LTNAQIVEEIRRFAPDVVMTGHGGSTRRATRVWLAECLDFAGHGLSRLFAPRPVKRATKTLREFWGAPLPDETALRRERAIIPIASTNPLA
jgi:hypothetical protein